VFEVGQHGLVAKLPVVRLINAIDFFDSLPLCGTRDFSPQSTTNSNKRGTAESNQPAAASPW